MSDLLNKNLSNIEHEFDLFGNKIEKLSMRDRIGFLPISIWEPDWNDVSRLKKIIGDSGESRELVEKKITYRGPKYSTTSIFNPHLAQMILSAYCPREAKIYDPFAGGGTRGFVATCMGHNYTGVELRQAEVERILYQQELLGKPFSIICEDNRMIKLPSDYFDFCYTCPPYYDLEKYSALVNDLSNAKSYYEFLDMMKETLRVTHLLMKTGSLTVFVVGNFRNKRGVLHHFNGDMVRLAEEVGYSLHDELIFHGASGAAHQRVGQFEANRKSVRVHEYILIFKK